MIERTLLDILACPLCGGEELHYGGSRHPSLVCDDCGQVYPIVDGIPDFVTEVATVPGSYRTETLYDAIAGVYDLAAPVMSLSVWNCDPLRYVDSENRALGRANGGLFLEIPIGTGLVLDKVLANYHDVRVIAIDTSWRMLRRAQKRLARHDHSIQLLRARPTHLPLRRNVIDSVQSLNGLHAFTNRSAVVSEMARVARPGGFMSGALLVRGERLSADLVLERFERYGVFPLLRTAPYVVEELRSSHVDDLHWETHGAALFYSGSSGDIER